MIAELVAFCIPWRTSTSNSGPALTSFGRYPTLGYPAPAATVQTYRNPLQPLTTSAPTLNAGSDDWHSVVIPGFDPRFGPTAASSITLFLHDDLAVKHVRRGDADAYAALLRDEIAPRTPVAPSPPYPTRIQRRYDVLPDATATLFVTQTRIMTTTVSLPVGQGSDRNVRVARAMTDNLLDDLPTITATMPDEPGDLQTVVYRQKIVTVTSKGAEESKTFVVVMQYDALSVLESLANVPTITIHDTIAQLTVTKQDTSVSTRTQTRYLTPQSSAADWEPAPPTRDDSTSGGRKIAPAAHGLGAAGLYSGLMFGLAWLCGSCACPIHQVSYVVMAVVVHCCVRQSLWA